MPPIFSIIVPFGKKSPYIDACVDACLAQSERRFELLVLPDGSWKPKRRSARVRVFPTGHVGPARKRDLGAKRAKGKYLAFLDDDAFPERDWLASALAAFREQGCVAAGGPAVTPSQQGFVQRLSALFFESRAGAGPMYYRYVPAPARFVDDLPSVNLFVERRAFFAAGGFDSRYYPGEDTLLCHKLLARGGTIWYDPRVRVYHHRRSGFWKHLRQVAQYGRHRGFFVKKFLGNSLRPAFFAPLFFVLFWVAVVALALFVSAWFWLFFAAYYLAVFIFVSRQRGFFLILAAPLFFYVSHVAYGAYFARGLFAKELAQRLRE